MFNLSSMQMHLATDLPMSHMKNESAATDFPYQ